MSIKDLSLTDQLHELHRYAIHEGHYDAADWMRRAWQDSLDYAVVPVPHSEYERFQSSPRTDSTSPQPERDPRTS